MEHWDSPQGEVMEEVIDELLDRFVECLEQGQPFTGGMFLDYLEDYGYSVVPNE